MNIGDVQLGHNARASASVLVFTQTLSLSSLSLLLGTISNFVLQVYTCTLSMRHRARTIRSFCIIVVDNQLDPILRAVRHDKTRPRFTPFYTPNANCLSQSFGIVSCVIIYVCIISFISSSSGWKYYVKLYHMFSDIYGL